MATQPLTVSQTILLSEVIPASKSLIITINKAKVEFRMDIYPHKSTYIHFNIVLTKLPATISSITTYCRLSCKQVNIIYKKTNLFSSENDTICWPSNQLGLSEVTNINKLQFKCTLEILNTLQKDHYMDFLSRTPLTTTAYPSSQWEINTSMIKLFTESEPGRIYYNKQNINNIWVLSCFPNGIDKRNKGQVILNLELIKLSPNISYIECNFELKSNHKSIKLAWQSQSAVFTYNKTRYSWPAGLFKNSSLSIEDTLQFTVDIVITKIGDIYGTKIKKSHWGQYGIMHNSMVTSQVAIEASSNSNSVSPSNPGNPGPLKVVHSHEPSWSMEVCYIIYTLSVYVIYRLI